MKKKPLDIIMINMSSYAEWERGVSNRNYHVMRGLLESDVIGKVLSVDYPPLTFKRGVRCYFENILSSLEASRVVARSISDKLSRLSERLYVYAHCMYFLRPEAVVKKIRQHAVDLHFGDFIVW